MTDTPSDTPENEKHFRVCLSNSVWQELEQIANERGLSIIDLMGLGLGLVRMAHEEQKKDNVLIVATRDGTALKQLVLPGQLFEQNEMDEVVRQQLEDSFGVAASDLLCSIIDLDPEPPPAPNRNEQPPPPASGRHPSA